MAILEEKQRQEKAALECQRWNSGKKKQQKIGQPNRAWSQEPRGYDEGRELYQSSFKFLNAFYVVFRGEK